MTVTALRESPKAWHGWTALVLAFAAAVLWLCQWTGTDGPNTASAWAQTAVGDGSIALLWWVAAAGFGFALSRGLQKQSQPLTITNDTIALALPIGSAALLAVDHFVARIGLPINIAAISAWIVIGVGAMLCFWLVRTSDIQLATSRVDGISQPVARWTVAMALGACLALLFVAASAAPGWLWSSEFGGYDAQSYHLVLARIWAFGGQPAGAVAGNVYSALPSFVECTFSRLMLIRGDHLHGAIVCQWWAAFATLATAWTVWRLATTLSGALGGIVAGLVTLATPWIVVVGTLAYNDIVPCLFFAGGWLVLLTHAERGTKPRLAVTAVLSLLAASAIGAKPTAAFMMALPLLAMVLFHSGFGAIVRAPITLMVGVGVIAGVLLPWFVRNELAYGNPVFPFAAQIFGNGPWSAEQFELFSNAHSASGTLVSRVAALVPAWLLHGVGEARSPAEPWFPQWGLLPIAGLVGLGVSSRSTPARSALIALALMVCAWLFLTHLQSRFLLPTAVPLAVGCAMLVQWAQRFAQPIATITGASLVACTVALLFRLYALEPNKPLPLDAGKLHAPSLAIGVLPQLTGEAVARALEQADDATRQQLLSVVTTPVALNVLLPQEARIIGIGFATPFYVLRPMTTTTVWDRGDFDRVAEANAGTPSSWGARLTELGYTHALIDPTMLSNWTSKGWLNPQLAQGSWFEPFMRANRLVLKTSEGRLLVELTPSTSETSPTPTDPNLSVPPLLRRD
ncbi:MAG: hypothetical protein QM516_11455 [Limnohabitans sp.]|nr:hypothetical protein [Limnohabitans sp.]